VHCVGYLNGSWLDEESLTTRSNSNS